MDKLGKGGLKLKAVANPRMKAYQTAPRQRNSDQRPESVYLIDPVLI